MKKSDWKGTAELIGIAAIVASLIFVGLELRQTQSALMASTYQARAFDAMNSMRQLADSEIIGPVLAKIDLDDEQSLAKLDREEHWRVRTWVRQRLVDFDNEYYQYQSGYLDEGYFRDRYLPSLRVWAKRWRAMEIPEGRTEFRMLVDELLSEDIDE